MCEYIYIYIYIYIYNHYIASNKFFKRLYPESNCMLKIMFWRNLCCCC